MLETNMWPLPFHGHKFYRLSAWERTSEWVRVSCEIHLCKTTTCCADASREQMWLLIYICVGVAAFILLSVCSYCEYLPSLILSLWWWMNWFDIWLLISLKKRFLFISVLYNNIKQDNTNSPVTANIEGKQ